MNARSEGVQAFLETTGVALFGACERLEPVGNFGEAFALELGGATLLPQFKALGDSDDEALEFESLELAEAISPIRRLLLQARHTEYTQPMRAPEPPPPPKQEPEPPPGPISDELIEAANEYCV